MSIFYVKDILSGDKKRKSIFLSFKKTSGKSQPGRNSSLTGSTDILYIYSLVIRIGKSASAVAGFPLFSTMNVINP